MEEYIGSLPGEEISDMELSFLIQMREEEKLARDVYTYLFDRWGIRIFYNISSSEQTHMDAIGVILRKYNITDPVSDNTPGVFSDPGIRELYGKLTQQGNVSISEALMVGATIEDLDIFDLQNALLKSDNMDILFVFGNLKKGSENHIRAFSSQLARYNIIYKAQYITREELDNILSSGIQGGGWGRNH
jgi:hypothetical protein